MLQLNNISKNYLTGVNEVKALRNVSLSFRESEFVAILGPSGCGKTTLLNIIGGLDRYTSGDLIINGISTKKYKDRDWDTYRNHSIGFVFQTYNLIPHQSVLANVELSLTLSGVSKTERRRRAKEVLEKVGLADQINKKPTQMSGGQMQRVAIARALINNPDILLADEPTGALDSETSVQIMELLKEIAKEKLVVMVTHNPNLAERYANRTIKLLDGEVISDSNEYNNGHIKAEKQDESRKTYMSFKTALGLSLNNLMTKKGRAILTAIAGSIGIIGIALILSLSYGVRQYIKRVEQETLSAFPIMINETSVDLSALIGDSSHLEHDRDGRDPNTIYSHDIMGTVVTSMVSNMSRNNLMRFKTFIEENGDNIGDYLNAVQYTYNIDLRIYNANTSNGIFRVNPNSIMALIGIEQPTGPEMNMMTSQYDVFSEMIDNRELLATQYDVIAGRWPEAYNEVILVVDENNEISDYALYALGMRDASELEGLFRKMMMGEEVEFAETTHTFEEFLNLSFKLVINSDYFQFNEHTGTWVDMRNDVAFMEALIARSLDLNIVGIIRPNEDALVPPTTGEIFYTRELTAWVIEQVNTSKIAIEQASDPYTNVFTGMTFEEEKAMFDISMLPPEQQAMLAGLSPEEQLIAIASFVEAFGSTYEDNRFLIGMVDLDSPSQIFLFPKDFDSKQRIEEIIQNYNAIALAEGRDDDVINYTDFIGLLLSGVTTIINVITYILIAFVSISLVVSSIMIGIITYISVLERTKEIGILRSVGASKKDISRVFNAETMIEGLAAGLFGIGFTLLMLIPANVIIKNITDVSNLAVLPLDGAIALIVISVLLTLLAGLIPAKMASRKDPVEALRTE